ncbi:MAG: flippase [Elusimicrobiaceae bacterium]|nr:flippase [Elusimicrobiaceae bacterium]
MKQASVKVNFIYNVLYELLSIVVPLATTPYLARVLGPDGLGEYSYAYAIAYYFVLFMQLGIKNYGTREIAKYQHKIEERSRIFWELVTVQGIFSVLAVIIYGWYSLALSSNRMMSLLLLPYIFSGALDITWCFSGMEDFKTIIGRSTLVKILTTIAIFLWVKSSEDITKYACVMSFGMFFSQLLLWPFLSKYIKCTPIRIKMLFKHLKPLFILFIPLLAVSIYKMMDKIMLGYMTDMTQVGFYESSERVLVIPLALITSLGTVMLPHMANLYATDDTKRVTEVFEKSIYFAMFLATSMGFGLMAVSKTFVPWFYGPDFTICITLFHILLPSSMFLAFANVIRTQHLIPLERDKEYVSSIIAGAIVNVLFNLLLIPSLGAIGAAIGTLCAEITVCVLQVVMAWREKSLGKYITWSLPFILSGMVMYLLISNVQFNKLPILVNLALQCGMGAGIYSVFCVCTLVMFGKNPLRQFQSSLHRFKNSKL